VTPQEIHDLADAIAKAVAKGNKAKGNKAKKKPPSPGPSIMRQLVAGGATGAVTGQVAYGAGQALGQPTGSLVGAGGALVSGGVSAAMAGGPVGAAVAGLAGVATAAHLAYESLKGFAAAASPNGMKGLDDAGKLFSATIGVVVVPAFTLLAAGVMTAADVLNTQLKPALGAVVTWYVGMIPMIVSFSEGIVSATHAAVAFAEKVWRFVNNGAREGEYQLSDLSPDALPNEMGKFTAESARAYGLEQQRQAGKHASNEVGTGDVAPAQGAESNLTFTAVPTISSAQSGVDAVMKNFELLTKDMMSSMGPKGGQSSGLVEAYKKAQEAAMQSGIEQKFMQRFQELIKVSQMILAEAKEQNRRPNQFDRGNN
jgi:hypothetical protein